MTDYLAELRRELAIARADAAMPYAVSLLQGEIERVSDE